MNARYEFIKLNIENRVGRVTLARPPLNVLSIEMMREIDGALDECASHRDMVAVVFDAATGSRAWCAGIALEEHKDESIYQLLEAFHGIFRSLRQMAKPTVAAVDGAALGAGCALVLGCDIVTATERARFGQPEIKLGILPSIATVLLPQIVGERRARELILTGELVGAEEAARIGLATHAVSSNDLEAKTQEILNRLRELSAPALEATRRALDEARGLSFDDALAKIENLYLNDLMKTEDSREGIAAFTEKRKPQWRNK